MKSKFENDILSIYLEGRIDSSNATEVGNQIDEELKNYEFKELVLNAKELEYLSSAGLRVVLALKKAHKNVKLINANQNVYEVFDMTGFTEFMEISRAYRKLSVDGCEIIGKGAKGTVYRYDKETVVKVYNNPDCLEAIQRERELARTAFVLGVPTAISYDICRVDGKFGSVFELLDAKSYSQAIGDDPANFENYVTDYANLLKTIHDTPVKEGSMPNYKDMAYTWIDTAKEVLTDEVYSKVKSLIDKVPDVHNMLHCDYHTNNIMRVNGEALVIDMDTLSYGHPIFDLANVYTAHVGFAEQTPEMTANFFNLPADLAKKIWDSFLPKYLGTDDAAKIKEVQDKTRLMAYTRILRHMVRRGEHETEEGKKHIAYYIDQVNSLSKEIDTLEF